MIEMSREMKEVLHVEKEIIARPNTWTFSAIESKYERGVEKGGQRAS